MKIPDSLPFVSLGISDKPLTPWEISQVLTEWIPALCLSLGPIPFDEAVALGRFIAELREAIGSAKWEFQPTTVAVVKGLLSKSQVDPKHALAAYLVHTMLESDGTERLRADP